MLLGQTQAQLEEKLETYKAIIDNYEEWIAGRGAVDSYTRGGISVSRSSLDTMQSAHSYWTGKYNQIQMQLNRLTGKGFTGNYITRICR